MTVSEISKNNHKHDIFTERQIQLALLQADEDFLRRDFFEVTKKVNYSNSKRKGRRKEEDDNNYELTGWVPDRNASLKKKEKDITDSGKSTNREYISWRDSKVRSLERHNYIFRHYKDVKKYIEQYRKECTCCKNSGIPSTKDTFDWKKLRGEKGSPILNHKNSSQKPETNSKNTNPKPHTFSYTTRNASYPFNGYTDFFSGNTSTFMANMEKNVQKILKSDSEKCNGDGDVYNRKASHEDSSHLYVRSNGTEIKTSATSNRQSPRVRDRTPSRTKLTPPLKIRTLDALHTDCNHQDSSESEYSDSESEPSPENPQSPNSSLDTPSSPEESQYIEEELRIEVPLPTPIVKTEPPPVPVQVKESTVLSAPSIRIGEKSFSGKRRKTLDSPSIISLKDSRFIEPNTPLCAFTAEYTPAIAGAEKKVWNPTKSAPFDKEREIQRGREAGMNCPFKVRDGKMMEINNRRQSKPPSSRGDLMKGKASLVHQREGIDPPGKMEAVLVQTGADDSEFPQPMCFTIKKGTVKNEQTNPQSKVEKQMNPRGKQVTSNEEVLRMRRILSHKVPSNEYSSFFETKNSSKERAFSHPNRTESNYRQKLCLPVEELAPCSRAAQVINRPDSRPGNRQGIPSMPKINNVNGRQPEEHMSKVKSAPKEETTNFPKISYTSGKPPQRLSDKRPSSGVVTKAPSNVDASYPLSERNVSQDQLAEISTFQAELPRMTPWITEEDSSKFITHVNKFASKCLPAKLKSPKDKWSSASPTDLKLRHLASEMTESETEGDVSMPPAKTMLQEMNQGPQTSSGDSQDSSKSNNTPSPTPSFEPTRSLPRLNISPFLPNDPETKTNLHRRCSSESDTKSKRTLQETEHSVGLSPIPLGDLTSKSTSSPSINHQQDCDGQTPSSTPNKTPCTLPIIGKSQPLHHSQKKSKHREKRPARRSQNTEFDSESEDKEIANWREKLDALRKVRKPHLKPKERSRRFNVYREDNLVGRFEIAGESHCIAQRQKIQELLENSRVKLKTICSQMDRKSSQPPDFDELINAVRGCQIQNVSNDGRTGRKSKPMKLTT